MEVRVIRMVFNKSQNKTTNTRIRASHERTKEKIVSRHEERCWLLF